ncbi:MAG: DNA-binding response OmpR family regulator [Pseudohongiellaceae bacterium]|jgi:DNA-binding response OmpR family regulator
MENFIRADSTYRILIVEDDVELASLIQEYLYKNGFSASVVSNGIEAEHMILNDKPNLVILDVMLPGKSGMDICRDVRSVYHQPILMLTALDEDIDQMLGLELGADDYVIKPVKPRLLLTRVRALLRRAELSRPQQVSGSELQTTSIQDVLNINTHTRTVTLGKDSITLTTAEYDLLFLLTEQAGEIVSRNTIVQSLRGFEYDGMDRSIDRRISRLRKKLFDDSVDPQVIKTVRGKGYLLCAPLKIN